MDVYRVIVTICVMLGVIAGALHLVASKDPWTLAWLLPLVLWLGWLVDDKEGHDEWRAIARSWCWMRRR